MERSQIKIILTTDATMSDLKELMDALQRVGNAYRHVVYNIEVDL